MTKIKIESKPNRKYEIPVQRIGGVALNEDPKDARIARYSRRVGYNDSISKEPKNRMPKSLADQRAEVVDWLNKLSAEDLKLAREMLEQDVTNEDVQRLPESELVWSSDEQDGTTDGIEQEATETLEELMGAQSDLDEEIRSARHALRKEERENASLEPGHDDDKQDYVLDGINIKNGRPNQ
jgi:hypothetical protein